MKFVTRLSIAALVLPCIQCQAELADPAEEAALQQEALSSVTWSLTGSVTPTTVTGVSGSDVHTLGDPDSTQTAIYAVLSRERSDEPCYVAVGAENLNDETIDSVPVKDHCGEKGPKSSTLHADFLDVNAGGADDHIFIRGVNVCLNRGNDKVKGISVVGLKLKSDGTTSTVSAVSDDRTNCHHWSGLVTCPTGQIATAVKTYFAAGNEPKDLTGLSLECREVVAN